MTQREILEHRTIQALIDELEEIKAWTLTEKIPLRSQELESIDKAIELGKIALREKAQS